MIKENIDDVIFQYFYYLSHSVLIIKTCLLWWIEYYIRHTFSAIYSMECLDFEALNGRMPLLAAKWVLARSYHTNTISYHVGHEPMGVLLPPDLLMHLLPRQSMLSPDTNLHCPPIQAWSRPTNRTLQHLLAVIVRQVHRHLYSNGGALDMKKATFILFDDYFCWRSHSIKKISKLKSQKSMHKYYDVFKTN